MTSETSAGSQEEVISQCIVDLQSISKTHPIKERVKVTLSSHSFYSGTEADRQVSLQLHQTMVVMSVSGVVQDDLAYNLFEAGSKQSILTVHQAQLRAKMVAIEHLEQKEDCTEGAYY